jgi:Mg-chelatase subunit ChlD
VALAIRFLLLGLFIIVLAEPRSMRKDDRLAIVFAIDVSASIRQDAVEAAQQYVIRIGHSEKPARDLAGLIYFARDAAVQLPPRAGLPADEIQVVNVRVDREGTDLAKALSLAAAMIPEDTNGRIVLVSDGVETQGALGPILDDLKS